MAQKSTAFISVGANLNPERNIEEAMLALMESATLLACSTFYWTEPIGRPGQPMFLNGVWKLATELSPMGLKRDVLREIETRLGRVRSADKYAPRPIDLDLIIYADMVVRTAELSLPDPGIRVRDFLAVPLTELDPDLILPDTKERLASLPIARETAGLKAHDSFSRKLKGFLNYERKQS